MTNPALVERITRSLAYMLRHQPEQFDLELDRYGYADLTEVVQALNERLDEAVEEDDVEDAVHSGDRARYEIVGEKIRALYGHSIDVEPGEAAKPPELLYVGVGARDADRAEKSGLRGGRRRFLHLALSYEDAVETGRRLARRYAVITVHALDAWEEGVNFYDRKALYLSEPIPVAYLEVGEMHDDGEGPPVRGGERSDRNGRGRRGGGSGGGRGRRDSRPSRDGGRDEDRGRGRGGDDRPRGGDRGRSEERGGGRGRGEHHEADRARQGSPRDAGPRRESRDERPARQSERPERKSERPTREREPQRDIPRREEVSAAKERDNQDSFGTGVFEEKKKASREPKRAKSGATESRRAEKPVPAPAPKPKEPEGPSFGEGI